MKSGFEMSARNRRRVEEIANSLTHGSGLLLSAAGGVLLVTTAVLRGGWISICANTVFALSLLALYSASTWYHGSARPRTKRLLRRFDHGAIYILIAGSNTPFLTVTLGGALGWGLLAVIWVLAATGMAVKLSGHLLPEKVSVASYVAMGWMCLVAVKPLYDRLPPGGFALLVAGGLAYTGGVYFYVLSNRLFHHAVWHLFVLAGSICHFLAVLMYVR